MAETNKVNTRESNEDLLFGIDLGTTYSCIGTYKDRDFILATEPNTGKNTMKSSVTVRADGSIVVGNEGLASMCPAETIIYAKSFLGREVGAVEESFYKNFSFKITTDKEKGYLFLDKKITPVEASAYILGELRKQMADKLGVDISKVKKAVITVPAYFNDAQRQATINAAQIAGLEVLRIINEPTAAAVAYGLTKEKGKKVIVFDLGGGTFDVSFLSVSEDSICEVIATAGLPNLGGGDFDRVIADYIISEYEKKTGKKPDMTNPMVSNEIRLKAMDAKIGLTASLQTTIIIPSLNYFSLDLSRAKFNEIINPVLERAKAPCLEVLKKAKANGISEEEIKDAVLVLVGGQTRTPKVQEFAEKIFNKKSEKFLNPDLGVCQGATLVASTFAENTKEGVASNLLLIDVASLSIGIETLGGVFYPLIKSGSSLPTKASDIFSTAENNQTSVVIVIFEGESPIAKNNRLLGSFILSGIEAAPKGIPQIEVVVSLDVNGILTVSATDKKTGKSQSIKVEKGQMSKEEIEELKKKFNENLEKDQAEADLIKLKNNAQDLIHNSTKTREDQETILSEELKSELQQKEEDLNKAIETNNHIEIQQKSEALSECLCKVSVPQNQENKA